LRTAVPPSRYAVFFALAAGLCACDLAAKSWAFARFPMDTRIHWLWPGMFGFQTSLNEGGLFGMGQGLTPVLAALAVAAVAAVLVWMFGFGAARDRLLAVTLAVITAGIVGNLYDRMGLPGLTWPDWHPQAGQRVYAVRDFIVMFQFGDWHWPNYNIADSCLVCGAGLLIWHSLRTKPRVGKEPTATEGQV
jgi:signal peptidase II